jgi:hypothetical protein
MTGGAYFNVQILAQRGLGLEGVTAAAVNVDGEILGMGFWFHDENLPLHTTGQKTVKYTGSPA